MKGFLKNKTLMTTRKIIVEDGIYHVTQRAPGKEIIFIEKKDYLTFIYLLKETAKKFKIDVFCFALLSNHLHLLVKIKEKNLSEAMRYLFKRYAQIFNKKYHRKGHVFCGAYRASLCCDDRYLITASVYIHLNPLKARLTKDIFKYKWTSLGCYTKELKNHSFIKNNEIIEMLGENKYDVYKSLINETAGLKYDNIIEDRSALKNFSDSFFELLKQRINKNKFNSGGFDNYLKEEKIIGDLTKKQGKIKPSDKKAFLYAIEQLRARGYSYDEIAKKLQTSRSTIYRLLRQ